MVAHIEAVGGARSVQQFSSYQGIVATRGSELTPTQRWVYACVAMRANGSGECWASVTTLAADTGFYERTVRRSLKELAQMGVLEADDRPGRTTLFRVTTEIPRPDPGPSGTPVTGTPRSEEHPGQRNTPVRGTGHPGHSDRTPRSEGPDTPVTVTDDPSLDPSNDPSKEPPTPTPPTGGVDPPTVVDGLPQWARRAAKGSRHTAGELLGLVVACVSAVRAAPANPDRCATDAKPLLALWRALERPPLDEFRDQFVLVAEAARGSPQPLFARDIRAEGWPDGHDRSGSVATLAVQRRWAERLEVAQAWDREGRPRGVPRPGQPIDLRQIEHEPLERSEDLQRWIDENEKDGPLWRT